VRIDAACSRFEADWREGKAPSIEAFLDEFGGPDGEQRRLLFELLALEVELFETAGESVAPEPYRRRFPYHGEVIDEVFANSRLAARGLADADEPATIGQTARGGPRRFGDYELLEEIARGGMGVVYRARQISLNRVVALKMILSGQFASEAEVRRFRAEAEAAAHLEHPGIVPIFEVGRHQGQAFFSMKLVGGGNLTRHLLRFLDDPEATARLMATIARTVQHAHKKGMIHRDLKPSNILLDESGQPLVADFGLVKWAKDASSLTASGALLGTPTYMAPEQVSGEQVTPAADIYSLGAVLYQLLTGRPPFRGATVAETLAQVLEHDPIPPRQVRPSIPRELESICLRCLEKSPSKRYPSAAALAADLERFVRGEAIHVGQAGLGVRLARWARREPEFACRLVGQSLILALTQVNYLLNPSPDKPVHLATTAFELLWIFSSLRLRRVARSEARWEWVRMI
jgi:serine/threonine-protein kinase